MCRIRANFSRLAYPMQDTHIRERKVLRALFLIAFLSSVFLGYCIFFCLSSADFRRRRIEKMGFPDVSSFPCPSPYRGCGGRPFGNRIHHLMRSFHSSIINIAEGSIFRPPWEKNFRKILGPILRAPPSSFLGKEPALRVSLSVPSSFCCWK